VSPLPPAPIRVHSCSRRWLLCFHRYGFFNNGKRAGVASSYCSHRVEVIFLPTDGRLNLLYGPGEHFAIT
jgi:hypothetical protein